MMSIKSVRDAHSEMAIARLSEFRQGDDGHRDAVCLSAPQARR
jgi:hypothetical protein